MVGEEGVKAGAVGEKNQHGRFAHVTRQALLQVRWDATGGFKHGTGTV